MRNLNNLSPKLFVAKRLHLALALGAGVTIPYSDVVAAALQAEPSHLASVRRCHVSNNATHHNVLDAFAVGARHGAYFLTEEPAPLVHFCFIATLATAIFEF